MYVRNMFLSAAQHYHQSRDMFWLIELNRHCFQPQTRADYKFQKPFFGILTAQKHYPGGNLSFLYQKSQ
jgi:hypothetical protein